MSIKENIAYIKERVARACECAGVDVGSITLVGVTKTVGTADIAEAIITGGLTDIGENRVQELLDKYDVFAKEAVNVHLIGHLQTNKVKYVVGKTKLIHSVDSIHVAREISRQSLMQNLVTNVLIQVNVSGEQSKFGIAPVALTELLEQIEILEGIKVQGLMTVPPLNPDSEASRKYFRQLFKIFVDNGQKKYNNSNMVYLSMGMSGDYSVAIEEGANIIRVGSAIFGRRIPGSYV